MQRLNDWLRGGGRRDGGTYDNHAFSSEAAEAIGAPEQPPQGFFRRLGFRARGLGRRCWAEFWVEWPLLRARLWVIIPCLIFQYIHAIFTGMAYYMHTPLPIDNTTLHDLGFEALPYLNVDAVSEGLVYGGFGLFFLWLVSPFLTRRKTFHAAVVLKRVLVILVLCQALRILTFLSTQLPGPAPHCRRPEPTSDVPWPVWWRVIIVNVARQASKGCGDLIFSSHITFILTFVWTYAVVGRSLLLKAAAFLYTAATALCIIASRKHYTVDITVAAYVVPLVAFHFFRRWTTQRDDICTADNRGIVSLLPAAPGEQAAAGQQANGGAEGSGKQQQRGQQRQAAVLDSADLEAGGGAGVELTRAPRSSSFAAVLEAGGGGEPQPSSPVAQAWGVISDLPRRLSSRTSSQHRRTDSQEPVLAAVAVDGGGGSSSLLA